tara:strand:- start:206 stop:715 length:510 start_codon:yes stop_codon:yes gene_type:complete
MTNLLTRKIILNFNSVGKNLKETLEKKIKKEIEGKCSVEGFIKPNSTKIVSYSSGLLIDTQVMFEVVFECLVCCPVEGMRLKCTVQNITQAGIRAVIKEDTSPIIVYITRDHHYNNTYFNKVTDGEEITVRVIGQRYELNDLHVSVIGEIIEPKGDKYKKKVKLVIEKA